MSHKSMNIDDIIKEYEYILNKIKRTESGHYSMDGFEIKLLRLKTEVLSGLIESYKFAGLQDKWRLDRIPKV